MADGIKISALSPWVGKSLNLGISPFSGGSPFDTYKMTFGNLLNAGRTGLTGGGVTNLDGTVTATEDVTQLWNVTVGNVLYPYQLKAGTASQSLPNVVLPLDYSPSDNPKYFQRLSVYGTIDATTLGNGFVVQTSPLSFAARSLVAPANGITISNADGTGGNPTFGLANDLAAVEGMSTTGIAVRTGVSIWNTRTITGTANQVAVTNGDGVSGNPTLALPQSIDTAASVTFAALNLSGLTASRLLISDGSKNIAVHAALTTNGFLYAGGAGTIASTLAPTNGQLLVGVTSGAPVLGTITGTAGQIGVSLGAGTITLSTLSDAGLPSQTGHSGQFLTTNGTSSSWSASLVTALAGTANQVTVSGSTGSVTISLPATVHIATGIDVGASGIQFGDGGGIAGATIGAFYAVSDGVFRLLDSTGGGSPSLIFGSNSSTVGIRVKRVNTTAAFRLGDDSADAAISASSATLSALTATRVPYASTGGLLIDSTNMTFDGTLGLTLGGSTGLTTSASGAGHSFHGGGTVTGASGAITVAASGTNQNITLTPSGTGAVLTNSLGVNLASGTPATELEVDSTLTTSPRGILSAQFTTDTLGARLGFRKARGTRTAPTVVVTGDNIGRLNAWPYDGANYLEMASIIFGTEGTIAATRTPTNISFWTGTNAAPSVLTQAVTIDSSQRTGFGTPTPGSKVDIQPGTVTGLGAASALGLVIENGNGSVNNLSQIGFGYNSAGASTNIPAVIGYITTSTTSSTKGALIFATRDVTTDTAPTEQMRIASSGNVLLGTTTDSSNGRIQLATHTTSAGGIGFGTDTVLYRTAASSIKTDGVFQSANLQIGAGGNQITEVGTNGASSISVNYNGYGGGTSQFRDFAVFNGKNSLLFSLSGSTQAALFTGAVTVNQTAIATSTTTLAFLAANTTASTSGAAVQNSPVIQLGGHAWNTTVTAADNYLDVQQGLRVVSGTTPTSSYVWAFRTSAAQSGAFTDALTLTNTGNLTVPGSFTSTVSTGTAPLVVSSTTAVANLNASLLLGATWASPGSIGATTPNAGAFTTLTANGFGLGVTSTATAAGTTVLTSTSTSVQIFTGTTTQAVTLPAANAFGSGIAVTFTIKNRSTGDVTINRAGSDTIDGATSFVLSGGTNAAVALVSDGSAAWQIV